MMRLNLYLVMTCKDGLPTRLGAFESRALAEAYAQESGLDPPSEHVRSLYAPEGMQEVGYVCFGDWGSGPDFVGVFLDPTQVPNLPLRPDNVQFYEIRIGSASRYPKPFQRIRIEEGAGTSRPVHVERHVVEATVPDLLPRLEAQRFRPWRAVAREFFENRLGIGLGAGIYAIAALICLALAVSYAAVRQQSRPLVWDLERTMGHASAAPWLHPAIRRARVYEGPGFRYFTAPLESSRAIPILSRLPTVLLNPDVENPIFFIPLPDYFGEESRMPVFEGLRGGEAELARWRERFHVNVREGMVWREGDEWLVYDFERQLLFGRLSADQPSPWARASNR